MATSSIAQLRVQRGPAPSRSAVQVARDLYSTPSGWANAVVTTAFLTYGGGVIMFWFHAIHRGERGPAISDQAHWLLDSTLGFVGLMPAVLVLLPLARALAWARPWSPSARDVVFAVVVGALFALVTAPGPFLHNLIAGAGTPLADAVTALVGHDADVAARNLHAHHRSPVEEGLLQVLVGFPVYTLWSWLAVRAVDALPVPARPRPVAPAAAPIGIAASPAAARQAA